MRRTKQESLATKHHIIESAVQLFLQKGFSDTTLEEIAERSEVTRGAIYWHFEDKLDIVKELITEEHCRMSRMLAELFSENVTPFAKIQKIAERTVEHFFETATFRNFIELTWFKIEYTQLSTLQTSKMALTDQFISELAIIVQDAQRAGEIIGSIQPSDVAITITNMINGMYRLYFIAPDQMNCREDAAALFSSYFNLLRK